MSKPSRRGYQQDLISGVYQKWSDGAVNVVGVLPTGAGKTKTFASMIEELQGPIMINAHRRELVGQISVAVAEFEVPHNIVAANGTIRNCVDKHIELSGRSFYDQRSRVTIASTDTINAQADDLSAWASRVAWWVTDECHHVLSDNKWGRALKLFTNARGLGVTATPLRADRKSLHRLQGGLFDEMVVGPTMRQLIDEGYLCDYIVYAPPASIRIENLKIGSSGDYTQDSVRKEAHDSQIVGDVVSHYKKFASGKRTIVFAVDIEQSKEIAQRFCDAGYRAAAVDGSTPETIRDAMVDKFRRGVLDILINVDLFGEGFDVPACDCVIFARPTQSFGLFVQQFGRPLRPAPGKTHGIVIDAVGNVKFHGLPDAPRRWSLFGEERSRRRARDPEAMPVTSCSACMRSRDATLRECPHCGHVEQPASRGGPDHVDGDLGLLDPETLRMMRGEIDVIDGRPLIPKHLLNTPAELALIKKWQERQFAQHQLRETIAIWAGVWKQKGHEDSAIHRRFYYRFGIDVLSAMKLGVKDAEQLISEISSSVDFNIGRSA